MFSNVMIFSEYSRQYHFRAQSVLTKLSASSHQYQDGILVALLVLVMPAIEINMKYDDGSSC